MVPISTDREKSKGKFSTMAKNSGSEMTQKEVKEHLVRGVQLAQAGDIAGAEDAFSACIAAEPSHAAANFNLGILLANRNAWLEAEAALVRSISTQATIKNVTAYAELLEKTNRRADAARCYTDILNAVPEHAPTLRCLATLYSRTTNRAKSREFSKRAWDAEPADFGSAIQYGIASYADDPLETITVLDKLLGDHANDDTIRLKVLNALLPYREFGERVKRNLMPHHATSLDELYYTYCAKEFALFHELSLKAAAEAPDNPGALYRKLLAHICAGEKSAAQKCLARYQTLSSDNILSALSFDPVFFEQLEQMTDDDLIQGLPPLEDIMTASFTDSPVIYLSCNLTYFTAFALPMIRSLADKGPGNQVHVHIMDATGDELAEAKAACSSLSAITIAMSAEQPGVDQRGSKVARCYYHAIRFIRFYQHLRRCGRTLWLMDVDALFNRDPREMFPVLGDMDAAFRIRAGRLEPWNQFNACVVAATPSDASLLYFRLIAAYIAYFYQRNELYWGIDQLAMYCVFERLKDPNRAPTLTFLDDQAIDYDYKDDGFIWCNSGGNKFAHLAKNADGKRTADDPDRAKYLDLFDKYSA